MLEPELRHWRQGGLAKRIRAGLQKSDRHIVAGHCGQSCDLRGNRRELYSVCGLERKGFAQQPPIAIVLTRKLVRRVTVPAHRHALDQIFPALDLGIGRRLRASRTDEFQNK